MLRFNLLESYKSKILYFCTAKSGLYGVGGFECFNMSLYKQDCDKIQTKQNHAFLAKYFGFEAYNICSMALEHKDKMVAINNQNASDYKICDGLATSLKNYPLIVCVADCLPVILYDKEQNIICAVHAGRSGLFLDILGKSIAFMSKTYNSRPKNIIACIGPCIHKCCYEIKEDIQEQTKRLHLESSLIYKKGKIYLDLLYIAKYTLIKSGINKGYIDISPFCTSCNNDTFYSYRKNKDIHRFALGIMLK